MKHRKLRKDAKTMKFDRDEQRNSMTVDLDGFDLSLEMAVKLMRFDILKDGKRVTVSVELFQHELKADPTISMTVCNRSRFVTRNAQVKPWVRGPR